MDTQKDSQRTDGIIKFLDYQTLKSNPFGENRVGERLYRRSERIASAIVLLTNHLDANDPLCLQSRISALDILSKVIAIRDEMRSSNSTGVSDLKISVRKTISLVRLLAVSGYISIQNAEIVVEALDELLAFLNASRRSSLSESVSISREDLIDVREKSRFPEPHMIDRSSREKEVKDTISSQASPEKASLSVSSRTQAILEVLRSHGEMGIRDVASNLPEYSEKMIQRELAELVAGGRVKKSGLKRWSRYTYIEAL
jgi:hypothetical protein